MQKANAERQQVGGGGSDTPPRVIDFEQSLIRRFVREYLDCGYSAIPIKPKTKKPYVAWKEFQERRPTGGEWEDWLIYFLNGVALQSRDAVVRVGRLQNLQGRYREQLRGPRVPARLLQAVDLLFAQPIVTVRQVEAALDVNFTTAQRYVDQLADLGMLREITGQARNRVYRAEEVLQAIEELLET